MTESLLLNGGGELSLLGLALIYAVTLVGTIPYFAALRKTEPGSQRRQILSRNLALVLIWPLLAMIFFVALPFVAIWAIMMTLNKIAPIIITGFVEPVDEALRAISKYLDNAKIRKATTAPR